MRLDEALGKIHGPVGFSSLVHGMKSGDTKNLTRTDPSKMTLEEAEERLERVRREQRECKSDYAYWGYEGECAALEAAVNIFKASEITGPDSLPDVPFSPGGGVLMDECAKLYRWSSAVLTAAKYAQDQREKEET